MHFFFKFAHGEGHRKHIIVHGKCLLPSASLPPKTSSPVQVYLNKSVLSNAASGVITLTTNMASAFRTSYHTQQIQRRPFARVFALYTYSFQTCFPNHARDCTAPLRARSEKGNGRTNVLAFSPNTFKGIDLWDGPFETKTLQR